MSNENRGAHAPDPWLHHLYNVFSNCQGTTLYYKYCQTEMLFEAECFILAHIRCTKELITVQAITRTTLLGYHKIAIPTFHQQESCALKRTLLSCCGNLCVFSLANQ